MERLLLEDPMKRTLFLTLIAGTLALPEAALAQGYDDLDETATEEAEADDSSS